MEDKGNDSGYLFIDSEDSFDVMVYYSVDRENGIFLSYRSDEISEDEVAELKSITFSCRRPDWALCRSIVAASQVNIGGRIVLDPGELQSSVIYHLVTGWDLKSADGEPLEYSASKLFNLRPDIVRCVVDMVNQRLVEEGIWDAFVQL